MRIVRPSATLLKHGKDPYEFIEKVGRLCYKSEDKIKAGSAEGFVRGLVRRRHFAILEHETIYLVMSKEFMREFRAEMARENEQLKYFNITSREGAHILSGSFRSFYELFERGYITLTMELLKRGLKHAYPLVFEEFSVSSSIAKNFPEGSCAMLTRQEFIEAFKNKPEVLRKHLTHTFQFVCDRGVSHEFVRHRPASYAQESTRYCCYVYEKFGSEISIIKPFFFDEDSIKYYFWKKACEEAEICYFALIKEGATPQEARSVLPHSLKTELIITATEEEWQHIVDLRYSGTTGAPHPQIKEVMGSAIIPLITESSGRISA